MVGCEQYRNTPQAELVGLEGSKLTGFFQEAAADYYYDQYRRSGELSAIFDPKPILRTDIVIYVRIVNVNPTPTTLHNFSLVIESEGERYVAEYPKEPGPSDSSSWTPPETIEKEKRMTNLVSYLNNPDKLATRGVGIDGYIAFRVPGYGVNAAPEKTAEINMTLFVEEAQEIAHAITDK
jgi:hypothetical protein